MELHYTLDRDDQLTAQLFQASHSEQIQKKRRKNRIVVPLCYLVIGLSFFYFKDLYYLIVFGGIAIAWFLLYPLYSRILYRKHYKKFIDERMGDRENKPVTLILEEENFLLKDEVSEGRVKLTELDSIEVITDYTFLHLSSGTSLILPMKKLKEDELESFLKKLEDQLDIKRTVLDWKWL